MGWMKNKTLGILLGFFCIALIASQVEAGPAPLNITTTSLPNGVQNVAYSQTLSATGGVTPYTWSVIGSLPPGLSLAPATGVISGTPTVTGVFNFTVQVQDSGSPRQTDTQDLSITIRARDIYVPQDYPTIQAAIDAAVNGDTVWVNDGTYTENINFLGKAITVRSVNGPASTIIDGNASGSVVTFNSGEGANSVLSGFTIRNGKATYGGGIYCAYNSSPTITNCTISNNSADDYGGGVCCYRNSSPKVINSILYGNGPQEIYLDNSTITVTYSDIQGGWIGEGNINADPLFVGGGDYHLTANSPCIDKGSNSAVSAGITTDLDGNPRIVNGIVDMGAYEFQEPLNITTTAAQKLGKVVVYPNPYKPNSDLGHNFGIRFGHPTDPTKRLTARATIRIYNIAGELVRTIEEPDDDGLSDGVATWDGENESGEKVASGIYIYYITNPEDERCVGKIGIIK